MPCMSLFTCHETLKYCVVVELLEITSSSNLKKKREITLISISIWYGMYFNPSQRNTLAQISIQDYTRSCKTTASQ